VLTKTKVKATRTRTTRSSQLDAFASHHSMRGVTDVELVDITRSMTSGMSAALVPSSA